MTVVGGDPIARRLLARGARRMNRDGDRLWGNRRVRLLRAVVQDVASRLRVDEHVREDQRVEVSPRVEGTDGIRVVRPALVTRDVSLHGPRGSAVPRLVEAEQVVVTLGADEPLALPDQMRRIGRVDANVGLGVVLHQQRRVRDVLGREAARLLAGRRARARRFAPARIAVGGRERG